MPRSQFPEAGMPAERLLQEMEGASSKDIDWRGGRLPGFYVHFARDDVEEIGREAFNRFFATNALGLGAFPSMKKFEGELVDWILGLFNAPDGAYGSVTSGGTESIFLAVKTARDRALARNPRLKTPKIVASFSMHPAFSKAAEYLRMEVVRVPLKPDLTADVDAMARAIDDDTVMLVGSAPEFTYGSIDPIEKIAALAEERGLWMHVDGCVGGFIAPFAERLGRKLPVWDFRVPGVTSISADLHKYGFTPKGTSFLAVRDEAHREFQIFDFDNWARGRYVTSTFAGTKPGANIAAAWAVMRYLGMDGYTDIVRQILAKREHIQREINAIEGLKVLGDPQLSVMSFSSSELDVYAIGAGLSGRGWYTVTPSPNPPAINMGLLSLAFAAVADEWLGDLREIVEDVRSGSSAYDKSKLASYGNQ